MPSDTTTYHAAIFWSLGSCSPTAWRRLSSRSPTLKLFLNLSDFNSHVDDSSQTLASQSWVPLFQWTSPSPFSATHSKFQLCTFTNTCSPQHFNCSHPTSWQPPQPFQLACSQTMTSPILWYTIHWSCHLLSVSHALCILSSFLAKLWCLDQSLPSLLHSFASPLVLLYSLGQMRTSTLVKCNTQPTLVPVLTNLNVARRQQRRLMLNSCTGRVWWFGCCLAVTLYLPAHLLSWPLSSGSISTRPQSLQKPWLLIH